MTDKELVQEEMRMAVRWAASSNYWSEKLREFFGPDARDGIVALEQQLRDAREELARLQQPEKTNQCAETCERAKLWGWAILHNDGTEACVRPRVKEFFGTISETEPFTAEDLRKADREWCGLAPHTMVTLYTSSQPEKTNQCAETCERAKLCAVCGVSLSQDAVAWMYTNAQGRAVIVESDVKPYDDAVPLFKSKPPEQKRVSWWRCTDAQGKTVVVASSVQPYDDAVLII